MTNRVLITGSSGFVGTNAVRAFRSLGMEVTGIDRIFIDGKKLEALGLSAYVCGDISLETLADCGKPDIIVHCAGGGTVGASNLDPMRDFTDTVASFNTLLEYCRRVCPEVRLVYVSSAAIYGSDHIAPIREDSSLKPVSPYGLHKILCEQMLRFYGRRDGLKGVIVRPFSIYGSGLRKQLLWDAVQKFSVGSATFSGSGQEMRDWIHVDDLAALLVVATQYASPDAPSCNAASQFGVSVRDVLRVLADAIGSETAPQFDGINRKGDPEYLVGNSEVARNWGWSPSVAWQVGISQYGRWAKDVISS